MKAVRRAAALGVACLAACAPAAAVAGDFASLQPIGFSADGKVFAFEEYGIQDGSGFAYSNIYVLDTATDTFLPGAPVRVVIEEESDHALVRARRDARRGAAPLIDAYRLQDHPGTLVAFNPQTEIDSPDHALVYDAYPVEGASGRNYRVTLDERDFPAEGLCKDFTATVRGFRLTMTQRGGVPDTTVLHDDARIPESRHCPTGYRLGGAMTYSGDSGAEVHILFALVKSLGFEGPDGRWIAIPAMISP